MSRPPLRVALIGAYSSRNLGDVAIEKALIENLRDLEPDVSLRGLSYDPADTTACFGIPAHPLMPATPEETSEATPSRPRRVLRAISSRLGRVLRELRFTLDAHRIVREVDLLIAAGGGQLDEYWGGAWGHPFALMRWSLLCRLAGRRFAVVSVGLCDLESRLGRTFVRRALDAACYRSFRDERTRAAVEAFGAAGPHAVVPDLAFSLRREAKPPGAAGPALRVGLSPVHSVTWTTEDDPDHASYLRTLTDFGRALVAAGHEVVVFPSELKVDAPLAARVADAIREAGPSDERDRVVTASVHDLDDLLATLADLDVVVASRLHGLILSHVLARPTLAISYHHKVETHMREIGEDEFRVPLIGVDAEGLMERFEALRAARDVVSDRIARARDDRRAQLARQLEALVALAREVSPPS